MGVVKLADYRPQLEVVEHRVADTEDGFMRVANEITDILLMADLTVRQLKVMLAIMRKTYGFNKPMDRLTNTQIAAMTGIHHTHVCAAKRQLIERKFLIADGVKIGVNKVVSQWISQDSLTLAKTANKTLAKSANGDNVTMIASSIQDAINAVPTLPFTASSSAGVVTLTARHKGLCGNEIPVSLNYYGFGGGEVLPAGVQIAVATGAAGTGAPVLTGAVAAMADEPFDYIGLPFNDTASVNTLVTEMNDTSGRWSYARQLYGHVYTAKIGTLSELVTAGDQFNQQHITLAGYEKETQTPADELAASRTARAAVFIRNDPARPTQTGELVGMLPAPKGKRFTMTEQQTLLSHGVATAYVESGVLRIQRDVTTYRKNAYGVADNSYLDSETLHTSAYVLRKLKSVITSKYGRHKLASDGTRFGPGQAIVTPAVIKGELLATYRQLERAGIVENYELFKQYLVVERDASDPNRLNTLFPPDYVNQLRVFAVVNQFRLQYSEESA